MCVCIYKCIVKFDYEYVCMYKCMVMSIEYVCMCMIEGELTEKASQSSQPVSQ